MRLKVDVIVTSGTPAILAAKQATAVIPIVFGSMGDPVGQGVVASLARPGGNITGLSLQTGADLSGKWLELFRAAVPGLRRLAILADRNYATDVVEQYRGPARALGLEVASYDIRRAEDIAGAFDALKGRADGLHVPLSPLVNTNQRRINTLAIGAQLPTFYAARDYVETGGLMSYGPNYSVLWRRAADFVDKILQGTKPADIPVEQPVKFDLVVNLTTAKAIGLTMFTKTAIALAIIAGIASGALAASKQSGSTSNWNPFDCRGVYVGSDPKILINRPQNGMCDRAE